VAFTVSAGPASEGVLGLLDQEFVAGRGRSISLQERYPSVFQANSRAEFLVCHAGDTPVAALALLPFVWQHGASIFRGTMLGLVTTHPAWRGQGCARLLLQQARVRLTDGAQDFAVLWTAQAAFYARQGWLPREGGVLGSYQAPPSVPALLADTTIVPAKECALPWIEPLRRKHSAAHVLRPSTHFATLPLPADAVWVIGASRGDQQAYALVGAAGETAYVYEMLGEPRLFARLWAAACQRWTVFVINEHESNPSYAWFNAHVAVQWQPKALAMWLPLSQRACALQDGDWHLPYFDRI
jgi:GNAT superfamily N-acetyltransferase